MDSSQSSSRRGSNRSTIAEVIRDAASYGLMCVPISLIENNATETSRQSLNGSRANQSRENIDEYLGICFPEHMANIMKSPPEKSYAVDPKYLMPLSPASQYSSLEEESDFSISGCEMEGPTPTGPVATTPQRLGPRDRRFYYRDKPRVAMPKRLDFGAVEDDDDGANTSQISGPSNALQCGRGRRGYGSPNRSAAISGTPRRSELTMSPVRSLPRRAGSESCPYVGQTTPVRRRSRCNTNPNSSWNNDEIGPISTSSPHRNQGYIGTPKHFSPRQYPQNCNFIRVVSDSLNDSVYLPDDSIPTGCDSVYFRKRSDFSTGPEDTSYDLAPVWKSLALPKRKKVVTNRIVMYLPELDDTESDLSGSINKLTTPLCSRRLRKRQITHEPLEDASLSLASGIDSIDLNATNEFDDQYLSDISEPIQYDSMEEEDDGAQSPCRNRSMNRRNI